MSYFYKEGQIVLFPFFHFEVKRCEDVLSNTIINLEEIPGTNLLNMAKYTEAKLIWLDANINKSLDNKSTQD